MSTKNGIWLLAAVVLAVATLETVEAAKLRRTIGDAAGHRRVGNGNNALEVDGRQASRGLCGMTGMCCQGKDNNCRAPHSSSDVDGEVVKTDVQDVASGNLTRDRTGSAGCFCDSACLELGDCCDDYKQVCQPVDCVLADEWDDYGECDSRCGPGIKQRRRRVMQRPMNGGRPCGKTVERIACEGTNCKVARAPNGHEELRETAYIIPSVYGMWRKSKRYDPFSDIRRNLFEHYDAKHQVKRPAYCSVFELTEVHAACNVTSAAAPSNGASSSAENWWNQLSKGRSVCVECQPAVMKKKLGGRCRGHGVLAKETRWDAVTVPGCRGRWVMKYRQEECQCGANNEKEGQLASFILV